MTIQTVSTTFNFRPTRAGSKQLEVLQAQAEAAGVKLEVTETGAMRPQEVHDVPTFSIEQWLEQGGQFVAAELQKLVDTAARKLYVDNWQAVDVAALTIPVIVDTLTPAPRASLSKENLALIVSALGGIMQEAGVPTTLSNAVKSLVSARFGHKELIKYQDKLESVGSILGRLIEAYLPQLPEELQAHAAQFVVEAERNYIAFVEALQAETEEVDLAAF